LNRYKKRANLNNYLINKTLHLSFRIKNSIYSCIYDLNFQAHMHIQQKFQIKKILKPCNRRCRSDHDGDTSHRARRLLCPRHECMSCCTTPTSRRWV
jgi:hypothetical protein